VELVPLVLGLLVPPEPQVQLALVKLAPADRPVVPLDPQVRWVLLMVRLVKRDRPAHEALLTGTQVVPESQVIPE
jgi:hypothetical protein